MCNVPKSTSRQQESQNPKPQILFGVLAVPPLDENEKTEGVETTPFGEIMKEGKALLWQVIPLIIINFFVFGRTLVSMQFLGSLGKAELAGGTLAMTFANITGNSVLTGLSLGMEPICSQAFGAGRPRLLSVTLHRTVLFLLAFSVPIAILWLRLSWILLHLNQETDVVAVAHTYILFSLPELVTNSLLHPLRIYLRSQKIASPITCASVLGTIIHVIATLILVLGLHLRVAGVAAAAAFSNLSSLLILVGYVWYNGLHEPTWTSPTKDCLRGWGQLVGLSVPSCLSVCLEWWWYEIMTFLGGQLVDPTANVASMGILIQATGVIYNVPSAFGYAVSTRVGNELGGNRPGQARRVAVVGISMAAGIGLATAGFAAGMKDRWGRFYSNDASILGMTAAAMPILALCELGNCPQTVACGVVRGTARPITAAWVNLGAFYVVGMPVAVGLGLCGGVGLRGLWIGLLVAQICCAGLMLYVVWRTDWAQQAEKAHKLACTAGGVGGSEAAATEVEGGDLREPLLEVVVAPPM